MSQPPEQPGWQSQPESGPDYGQQPGYGQPPSYASSGPQPSYGGGYGATPPSGNDADKITRLVWISASAVIVVALVVVLVVVLNSGGGGGTQADGTGSASASVSGASSFPSGSDSGDNSGDNSGASTSGQPSSSSPTAASSGGGSGTALPTGGTSATPGAGYTGLNCPPGESATSAVIQLLTAIEFVKPGDSISDFDQDIFAACATDAVRPRLPALYGKSFGLPSDDTTGGDGLGKVARFVITSDTGGVLTMTMVKTADNRYVCTDLAFR